MSYNGKKKAAYMLYAVASSSSSCFELTVQRMFLGIYAALNLTICGGNVFDAYAHASAGDIPTYLTVDEAYKGW